MNKIIFKLTYSKLTNLKEELCKEPNNKCGTSHWKFRTIYQTQN